MKKTRLFSKIVLPSANLVPSAKPKKSYPSSSLDIGGLFFDESEPDKTPQSDLDFGAHSIARSLTLWNFLLAFLYLGTCIAIFIWNFFVDQNKITDLVITCGLPEWSDANARFIPKLDIPPELKIIARYKIHILLLIVPLLSGIISLFRAISLASDSFFRTSDYVNVFDRIKEKAYFKDIYNGIFTFQLLERLLSGSLLSWVLVASVGITEIGLSITILFLFMTVFVLLYLHDTFNYLVSVYHKSPLEPSAQFSSYVSVNTTTKTTPMVAKSTLLDRKLNQTKSSTLYVFRSYGAYIGASFIHIWLWVIILLYYGYGGTANSIEWTNYKWAIIPIVATLFFIQGLLILLWTINLEYEDDYIGDHKTKNNDKKDEKNQVKIPKKNKIKYTLHQWRNNLNLEVSSLIVSVLIILSTVWTFWLGMLYT